MSDDWNLGRYSSNREFWHAVSNKADKTLRPVVRAVWHYTESDLLFRDDVGVEPPFNQYALPKYLGRGMYVESEDEDESGDVQRRRKKEPGRFINPVWVEADDPTRNGAAGRGEFLKEFNKGRKERKG